MQEIVDRGAMAVSQTTKSSRTPLVTMLLRGMCACTFSLRATGYCTRSNNDLKVMCLCIHARHLGTYIFNGPKIIDVNVNMLSSILGYIHTLCTCVCARHCSVLLHSCMLYSVQCILYVYVDTCTVLYCNCEVQLYMYMYINVFVIT